jgi:uroporphyrinogen-III synthase
LLKVLARVPGAVVSREVLLEALGGDDPHVVEAAVNRLRSALGVKELIATAVKRGYRLAVEYMPDDIESDA